MTSVLVPDGNYKAASEQYAQQIQHGVNELKKLDQEIQDVIQYAIHTFPTVSQRYDMFPKMSQFLPDKLEKFVGGLNVIGDNFGKLMDVQAAQVGTANAKVAEAYNSVKSSKLYHQTEHVDNNTTERKTKSNFVKRKRRKIDTDNNNSKGSGGEVFFVAPRMVKVDLTRNDFADGVFDDVGTVLTLDEDTKRRMDKNRDDALRQLEEIKKRNNKKFSFWGLFGAGDSNNNTGTTPASTGDTSVPSESDGTGTEDTTDDVIDDDMSAKSYEEPATVQEIELPRKTSLPEEVPKRTKSPARDLPKIPEKQNNERPVIHHKAPGILPEPPVRAVTKKPVEEGPKVTPPVPKIQKTVEEEPKPVKVPPIPKTDAVKEPVKVPKQESYEWEADFDSHFEKDKPKPKKESFEWEADFDSHFEKKVVPPPVETIQKPVEKRVVPPPLPEDIKRVEEPIRTKPPIAPQPEVAKPKQVIDAPPAVRPRRPSNAPLPEEVKPVEVPKLTTQRSKPDVLSQDALPAPIQPSPAPLVRQDSVRRPPPPTLIEDQKTTPRGTPIQEPPMQRVASRGELNRQDSVRRPPPSLQEDIKITPREEPVLQPMQPLPVVKQPEPQFRPEPQPTMDRVSSRGELTRQDSRRQPPPQVEELPAPIQPKVLAPTVVRVDPPPQRVDAREQHQQHKPQVQLRATMGQQRQQRQAPITPQHGNRQAPPLERQQARPPPPNNMGRQAPPQNMQRPPQQRPPQGYVDPRVQQRAPPMQQRPPPQNDFHDDFEPDFENGFKSPKKGSSQPPVTQPSAGIMRQDSQQRMGGSGLDGFVPRGAHQQSFPPRGGPTPQDQGFIAPQRTGPPPQEQFAPPQRTGPPPRDETFIAPMQPRTAPPQEISRPPPVQDSGMIKPPVQDFTPLQPVRQPPPMVRQQSNERITPDTMLNRPPPQGDMSRPPPQGEFNRGLLQQDMRRPPPVRQDSQNFPPRGPPPQDQGFTRGVPPPQDQGFVAPQRTGPPPQDIGFTGPPRGVPPPQDQGFTGGSQRLPETFQPPPLNRIQSTPVISKPAPQRQTLTENVKKDFADFEMMARQSLGVDVPRDRTPSPVDNRSTDRRTQSMAFDSGYNGPPRGVPPPQDRGFDGRGVPPPQNDQFRQGPPMRGPPDQGFDNRGAPPRRDGPPPQGGFDNRGPPPNRQPVDNNRLSMRQEPPPQGDFTRQQSFNGPPRKTSSGAPPPMQPNNPYNTAPTGGRPPQDGFDPNRPPPQRNGPPPQGFDNRGAPPQGGFDNRGGPPQRTGPPQQNFDPNRGPPSNQGFDPNRGPPRRDGPPPSDQFDNRGPPRRDGPPPQGGFDRPPQGGFDPNRGPPPQRTGPPPNDQGFTGGRPQSMSFNGPPRDNRGPPPNDQFRQGPPPQGGFDPNRGPPPQRTGPPPQGFDNRGPPPQGFDNRGPPRGPPPQNFDPNRGPPPRGGQFSGPPQQYQDQYGNQPYGNQPPRGPPPQDQGFNGPPRQGGNQPPQRRGPPPNNNNYY